MVMISALNSPDNKARTRQKNQAAAGCGTPPPAHVQAGLAVAGTAAPAGHRASVRPDIMAWVLPSLMDLARLVLQISWRERTGV
jgi:hypothetical protein